jgi:malonyl CoA-acyl carrier protein transacylase
MSALERARELERQRKEVLVAGTAEAVDKAIAAVRELRELVDEQLKALRVSRPAHDQNP